MNRILKTACASLMSLTVAATSLGAASPAMADDWRHDQWRGRGGWHNDWRGHQRYEHRRGGDDGAVFAIGAGILALGIAAAVASSAPREPRAVYRNPDDDDYAPPPPAYVRPRYYDSAYDDGGEACLQTREYQTTVTIDGRRERAYGTACLQPDGSWLRGPVQLDY